MLRIYFLETNKNTKDVKASKRKVLTSCNVFSCGRYIEAPDNFISTSGVNTSTSKFTIEERSLVKNIVTTLTLKRIPDNEIIGEIASQTNETITRYGLYKIRAQIKKESTDWFMKLRQSKYEYLHEFKERINEIMDLQKRCHELIESNKHNPQIQLSAIAELHKLNITLSNYIEVIPTVINGCTISTTPEDKNTESEESTESIITV